jgi:hypothetical protein
MDANQITLSVHTQNDSVTTRVQRTITFIEIQFKFRHLILNDENIVWEYSDLDEWYPLQTEQDWRRAVDFQFDDDMLVVRVATLKIPLFERRCINKKPRILVSAPTKICKARLLGNLPQFSRFSIIDETHSIKYNNRTPKLNFNELFQDVLMRSSRSH